MVRYRCSAMSEDEIKGKLRIALNEFGSEKKYSLGGQREVVYILVQVRKILELLEDETNFKTLKFHCDWCLHTKLSGSGARNVLGTIDEFFTAGKPWKSELGVRLRRSLCELTSMTKFKTELREMLRVSDLPCSICDNGPKWCEFAEYYSHIVERIPLVIVDRKKRVKTTEKKAFHKVKRVEVLTGDYIKNPELNDDGSVFKFTLCWNVECDDPRESETITTDFGWQKPHPQ